MRSVFVDSSGFYALLAPADAFHREAINLFRRAREERWNLVTTSIVVAETHALVLHKLKNVTRSAFASLENLRGACVGLSAIPLLMNDEHWEYSASQPDAVIRFATH